MKCNPNSKSSKVVTPANAKYRADVKVKSSVCDNVSYTSSYRRISDWLDSKNPISLEDRMKEVRWTFGASLILLLPWCMFELPDNSMSPTLESGYDVMGWRTKKCKRLKPLSVVALVEYDDKHEYKILMCRRIIGMPGDTVKIYGNGLISVNGKQLREPYLKDYKSHRVSWPFPMVKSTTVPPSRTWEAMNCFSTVRRSITAYALTCWG